MGKNHHLAFVDLVDSVRPHIAETTVQDVHHRRQTGETFKLIDVREESEWAASRIPGAIRLGKGIIERDIHTVANSFDEPLVLYCGGGYRSALAADSLGRMGYTHVESMDGGFSGWQEAGFEVEQG